MGDSGRGEVLRFLNKPVNFRPILFCALSFASGIFFFGKFVAGNLNPMFLAVALVSVVALSVLPFCIKRRMRAFVVTYAFCIAFALIGVCAAHAAFSSYERGRLPAGDYYVTGEVKSVSKNGDYSRITLKNCKYNGVSGGNLYLSYVETDVKKYDIVAIVCKAKPTDEYNGKSLSNFAVSGTSMISSEVSFYEITGRSDKIYAKFASFTDEILSEGMSGEEYAVTRSLLRGDTDEMSDEKLVDYRMSGIAHVFAVSGMHVGLVFAAFTFIFKLLPFKKIYKNIIITCLLFLYAYLCGMTASSVRAAVMCGVGAIVGSVGEKKDRVNSIALALIVVLTLNPFDLFGAGFILSFAVSFSIIALSAPVSSALSFMPKKISDSMSVMIAASITSIPLCTLLFGYFPLVSFVTNLVLIPLVTASFFTLWAGVIISAILPVNRLIALFIPSNLLKFVSGVCGVFSRFPLSVGVFPAGFAVAFFIAAFALSDLLNTGRKAKIFSAIYLALSVIFLTIYSFA